MRLAILALSAAALSGCSWLGSAHKAPGVNCAPTAYAGYGQQGAHHYGYAPSGPGCDGGVYGVHPHAGHATHTGSHYGHAALNAHGHPAPGYGPQAMPFQASQFQASQFQGGQVHAGAGAAMTPSGYPQGYPQTVTTLGASAPYGAAIGGAGSFAQAGQFGAAQFGAGGQFAGVAGANAQFGGYGGQVIAGAPIYVPQPYPAPYPVPPVNPSVCCGTSAGGAAMPVGFEFFGGTEIDAQGDLFTKKSDGPPDGDYTIGLRVGDINAISYGDAFGPVKQIGGALAYDLSPTMTVLGSVSYGRAEGQTVENYTTVQPGTWSGTSLGGFTFTPSGTERSLDGTFTDLETATIEGGVRNYVGHNPSLRPYFGLSGGFTHNNAVTFTQTYSDDGSFYGQRQFIDSGWSPTAAATIGAEMALGPRTAIGFESGVRWRDNMNTAAPSEDRVTIPLTLRGRLAF